MLIHSIKKVHIIQSHTFLTKTLTPIFESLTFILFLILCTENTQVVILKEQRSLSIIHLMKFLSNN